MERGPSNSSGRRWLGHWCARRSADPEGSPARDDPFETASRKRRGGAIKLARCRERALTEEMVQDCEAFLLGRYVEQLEARCMEVPAWAWTNVLAHGTSDDLRSTADDCQADPESTREWRAARAYVAAELLDTTSRGRSLADTQRLLLVPLELRLAARSDVEQWTPQRWVATVRSSIVQPSRRDLGRNGNAPRQG